MISRILIVTGGRKYVNRAFVYTRVAEWEPDMIVHGGASGADTLADEWARQNGIARAIFNVSDKQWKLFGNYAGPMRNGHMIDFVKMICPFQYSEDEGPMYLWDHGHPLIEGMAFPGRDGTDDMCEKMTEAGITYWDYRLDPEAQ